MRGPGRALHIWVGLLLLLMCCHSCGAASCTAASNTAVLLATGLAGSSRIAGCSSADCDLLHSLYLSPSCGELCKAGTPQ